MLYLWCFLFFISGIYCGRNNVCESYFAYNFKGVSNKCYYDPDADTNDLPVIIKHHTGKEAEIHEVTTEDGYFLTIHRMPRENPRGILWLQHPLIVDGLIWFTQSKSSLALLAYEAGYDVWIPSHRGTTLSPRHVNLTTKEFEYWTWSFHEIGIYDYRAINKYIVEKTNRTDIIFVGHSLSSTSSIVYASMYPEEARNNVKVFINMATPVFFEDTTTVLKLLVPIAMIFNPITNFLKIGPIFRYENPLLRLALARSVHFPFNALLYLGVDTICGSTLGEQDPDNDELYRRLPEEVKKYGRHKLAQVGHADYFIGKYIKEKVYVHVIDFMNKL